MLYLYLKSKFLIVSTFPFKAKNHNLLSNLEEHKPHSRCRPIRCGIAWNKCVLSKCIVGLKRYIARKQMYTSDKDKNYTQFNCTLLYFTALF